MVGCKRLWYQFVLARHCIYYSYSYSNSKLSIAWLLINNVKIIKALLHSRKAADLGPIICVCYTNHAFDQLLEHLVKNGVMQVIRLGLRSKSDLLQNLTLRRVVEKAVPTKTENIISGNTIGILGEHYEKLKIYCLG